MAKEVIEAYQPLNGFGVFRHLTGLSSIFSNHFWILTMDSKTYARRGDGCLCRDVDIMASTANTQTDSDRRAEYFLTPEQVDEMRSAVAEESPNYLSMRNEAIIALLYDSGLRKAELVKLNVDLLDLEDRNLRLPTEIQKDYPTNQSPPPVTMGLAEETVRLLRQYLNTRWRESEARFQSRQSDRATTETVRNVVSLAAEAADILPYRHGRPRRAVGCLAPSAPSLGGVADAPSRGQDHLRLQTPAPSHVGIYDRGRLLPFRGGLTVTTNEPEGTPDSEFLGTAAQLVLGTVGDPKVGVGNLLLVRGRNGEWAAYPVDDTSDRSVDIFVAERWGSVRNLAVALRQLNYRMDDEPEPVGFEFQ